VYPSNRKTIRNVTVTTTDLYKDDGCFRDGSYDPSQKKRFATVKISTPSPTCYEGGTHEITNDVYSIKSAIGYINGQFFNLNYIVLRFLDKIILL